MTLKLNIFFTCHPTFVSSRKCKLQSKVLIGVTLRREAKDYYSSQTLNFSWLHQTRKLHAECIQKGYGNNKYPPIKQITTNIFNPKGLAFEQSDSYLIADKKGSSNKKVNKKFIKFFKHWYFDMASLNEGNKQVREDKDSSLLVLPSSNLHSKKVESFTTLYSVITTPAKASAAVDHHFNLKPTFTPQKATQSVRSIRFKSTRAKNSVSKWDGFSSLIFTPETFHKGGDELSFSTWQCLGKGLTLKPLLHRDGPANKKLYLQNKLRGEWFLLKKVTDLKNYLTAFVNQENSPIIKVSDKELNARGLEAKTTNSNSILSFWLLSFVAFIIRLKLENPNLNLFLAHYPFGVSSVAFMTVPQNSDVTPKGIEASKIKTVLLLPKIDNSPYVSSGTDNPQSRASSGFNMGIKGVIHEYSQPILFTPRVPFLKQNNQIETGLHPLVPKVGTLFNYTKVNKLRLSAVGIKNGRLDQYYGYSFCKVSPAAHYPTMLSWLGTNVRSQANMPTHQYSKKISQEEYLLFKKSQEESLFCRSPDIGVNRSKFAPDRLAYKGTYFSTPEIVNINNNTTTQTTKMYIKASYLLSNLIKTQAFNNGYCFSYLPPVTKNMPNLKKEQLVKQTFFKKRVQKNKMSIEDTSVYNFIANGLTTVSVPKVLVDNKGGSYLAKSNKEIVRIHETTWSLVSNPHPTVWGPAKLIELTPGFLFNTGDENVINPAVSLEKTSLGLIERETNKTLANPFLSNYKKEQAKLLTDNMKTINAMDNLLIVEPTSKVARLPYPSAVDNKHISRMESSQMTTMNYSTPKRIEHKTGNETNVFTVGSGRLAIRRIKSENVFDRRALSGGWSNFKLDSVKSHYESNLLPLTPYVEGILFDSDCSVHNRNSGNHMLRMGFGSGMGVKRLGGVSTATTFQTNKQTPLAQPTYSKGVVEDTLNVFLFKVAHFFQNLFWDVNIYNVLWLKALIIKNADLTFKNHLFDKDHLESLLPPALTTFPSYQSSHKLLQLKRDTYAGCTKTGSVSVISFHTPLGYANIEKNRSSHHKPHTECIRFVEGKKTGNTKLLRSFMLLINHKKLQAKKKLTPFSINLEQNFREALSSKMGKKLSTVYEMRKLEKQEYRAQKENIETPTARPKKRKRFYPRPDWLRVRLYETLLTPRLAQPTIKSDQAVANIQTGLAYSKPARLIRQENNASSLLSSSLFFDSEKKAKGVFRENRSMPFYFRSSNGWGGVKNSLLLSSPTAKGVIEQRLNRDNFISNFKAGSKALLKFNLFSRDHHAILPGRALARLHKPAKVAGGLVIVSQVKNNINQNAMSSVVNSDSPNRLNNNRFWVWFFNTFYNFDSSNFLEVNNLSMLRIFWCLNQTNVCSITSFKDTKPNPEIWLNTLGQWAPIDGKKKSEETDSVFKGFTPFASHIRKMSPTQIKARFASLETRSQKIHPNLTASFLTPKEVNPSPSLFRAAKENNNKNENDFANFGNTTSWHKGMQTYATNNLTGGLSSFFSVSQDPMLSPLKQGDKRQAQKKKRKKQIEGNEVPHIEENSGFKNRDHVWYNQKYRELAENNKTKFLIRELSIKISNLTHAFPYSNCLNNEYNNAELLTLPLPELRSTWQGNSECLTNSDSKFNLTKYRQKQQKLNYLGVIPYSFEQTKGLNITSTGGNESRMQNAYGKLYGKTQFNIYKPIKYKKSIFEKKRLSPFYLSSGFMKEYAVGTKKQILEKKTTSKFWWLKNASFKALYGQHKVSNVTHAMQKGSKNPSLGTISNLLLASPFPSLPESVGSSQVGQEAINQVPAGLPRVEETILISLFSMATTVFFHFCCLIGLLSISQVRCAIKFYFILFYKLSKSYIDLISSLYGWTFQYPLSFLHPLINYYPTRRVGFATYLRVNAFLTWLHKGTKYSKGLVLARAKFTSSVLPASYPQIGRSISNLLRSRLQFGSTSTLPVPGYAKVVRVGGMKNNPYPSTSKKKEQPGRINILVWLNKRALFLVARIYPTGTEGSNMGKEEPQPRSWKGKTELNLLPVLTSLDGYIKPDINKTQLSLFNQFFVMFLPSLLRDSSITGDRAGNKARGQVNKQSFMLSAASIRGSQLEIKSLNIKNLLSFIRNNSIKTMVTVLQKSRFVFIKSVALLVFFFQDCFEAILRFFENPTELSLDFFAYTFLVELYSDSLSIMPEVMDLTIWNWFQKTTNSLKTSLFFGNLLQRRFFCFFYILLNTLNQPDTALIRQQVKGSLFWDLWADLLIKTVVSENQLDISSLARFEEEKTSLVDSLLFEPEVAQLPSLWYLFRPFWNTIYLLNAYIFPGTTGSKVREGMKKSYNTKFLHLTKMKHTYGAGKEILPLVNPLEISTNSSDYANPTVTYYPTPYRVSKEYKTEKRWGANQHVSYQQVDTDLFVDLNVSKSFSHVSGIRYYAGVQSPIGSLVCQIYTGLFETQAAKNVLVIGPASACTKTFDAKSLLIQALAGETEIKIILDNAARYTLVNRGLAVGIRLLKEVFNAIALQTPCFFLLEDVHLIGEKRLLLISDSSDAKKILNNKMPLSHIDSLEVHEKNHVMIQYSKQAVTHYKKPYRDSAEQSIATSQYCFDFFLGNKNKKRTLGKRVKGTSLPSPIPIISFNLNSVSTSNSTKQKAKPKKFLNEISFEENSKEPEFILVPRINYSVRLKIALLAQHTLSNFSAKVDMITDLLVIIDNVRSNKGFVVFATTNRAHRLDPALRRPGRLDETIRVPFLPTASARWEILKSNLGVFFKSTFSPFNVKRSICLDLIEFNNFSIQVNSALIMSPALPFYPLIPQRNPKEEPESLLSVARTGSRQFLFLPTESLSCAKQSEAIKSGKYSSLPGLFLALLPTGSKKKKKPTQVGIDQSLLEDHVLPNKPFSNSSGRQPHSRDSFVRKSLPTIFAPGVKQESMGSDSNMEIKNIASRIRIKEGSGLADTLLTPKRLITATPKSSTEVRYFTTPKKPKVDLVGHIGAERVKIMAYCKVAKKLILNSTVTMGSSIIAPTWLRHDIIAYSCSESLPKLASSYPPLSQVVKEGINQVARKPHFITTTPYGGIPSIYAKGTTLYWNSITWQEKTFITPEQKNQRFAIVATTPLQLPGSSENAKNALQALPQQRKGSKMVKSSTFLDLEKSESEWEITQDTTDAALSTPTIKRKLLNLFASKVAESFVCELFYKKHVILPSLLAENQSLVGGLGRKSVGFFNALTLQGDRTCNDWKKASSLVKSFLQKRYMYNKNTIVNSLLCVANGSFVGEFKDEPTNPPHSVILAPSKRYENYKKIFQKHEKKVFIKFSEKVQLHEQQKFIQNLYTMQNSKSNGPTHNTPVGTQNSDSHTHSTGSGKNMKWGQNLQGNAGQTFRPGLAVTDPNVEETNINNSLDGNYSKLSSVSWYYNASIVKRHQFYLTNQWFNGQLAEHNAETVFLSDVDWRLTFIEELGDLSIDFPDADQLYNPRHRRWLLNTSSLSGGTASSWHTFYNYDQEISDHLVMQAFNQIYVLLDKNREQLDALSYKLIKTGFLKELHLVKQVL